MSNESWRVGDLKDLRGRKITECVVSEDGYYITFVADGIKRKFRAVGDCCAHAYIQDVNGIDKLNTPGGVMVHDVVVKMVNLKNGDVVVDAYFYTINTNKGSVDIELRVEHNGYYGGELVEI